MERLFTYGSLQDPAVQQAVFGRITPGTRDTLEGYRKKSIKFDTGTYPIIFSDPNSSVEGEVISVTAQELAQIDRYETSAYRRIRVTLKSGDVVWVYCE